MYFLAQSENKKMKLLDLVPKVGLSHSALSRLVTRLEKHRGESLVQRQTDENDKRSVYVLLLKKGQLQVEEMLILLNNSLQTQISIKDMHDIKRLIE